ncbi:MAG: pilus assembly protein PilM [Phycisphaerales bacterium]
MSAAREVVVVGLDPERLLAAGASVEPGAVKVRAWVSSPVPRDMDIRDGAAVGAWLGEELKKAGLARSRLVFAASRSEVVIKRLRLPAPAGIAERELAGMVRLQMARQMTVPLEETAIDYVRIDAGEAHPAKPGEKATPTASVLAAALPGDRLKWYQDVARAAGCRIERIGLRSAGLAAMLADVSHRHNGPVLGIGVGWNSVEFVVVESGSLLFARSADFGPAPGRDPETPLVQRIAVEAKRTWMSYRVSDQSTVVDAVVVVGSGPLAREIAERCGESLEMACQVAEPGRSVELPSAIPELERLAAAALVGLLLEAESPRAGLDFAHPRKGADPHAARRRAVLAAALGVIVVGGASWVLGSASLNSLDAELKTVQRRGEQVRKDYNAVMLDDARLRHIEHWTRANVDWIAHVQWLSDQMPDPRQAHVDQLSGKLESTIQFVPSGTRYHTEGWKLLPGASFTMTGRVKRREVANDLRARLVASQVYTVESKGPDVPDSFGLDLSTALRSPQESSRAPAVGAPEKQGEGS